MNSDIRAEREKHRAWLRDCIARCRAEVARYEKAVERRPNTYRPRLAEAQHTLGKFYWWRHTPASYRTAFREEVLLGLLSAYESMAAAAPLVYGEDVASTFWQLGNLHADARRFGEAERMYLRALDKHAEFDGEDPHRYRPATAQCRRSLGRLYEEMHDDARAEEAYLASAAILRELCEDPFERCNHLRSLVRTLMLLADLCERRGACGEAARYRTEAEALEAERGA